MPHQEDRPYVAEGWKGSRTINELYEFEFKVRLCPLRHAPAYLWFGTRWPLGWHVHVAVTDFDVGQPGGRPTWPVEVYARATFTLWGARRFARNIVLAYAQGSENYADPLMPFEMRPVEASAAFKRMRDAKRRYDESDEGFRQELRVDDRYFEYPIYLGVREDVFQSRWGHLFDDSPDSDDDG